MLELSSGGAPMNFGTATHSNSARRSLLLLALSLVGFACSSAPPESDAGEPDSGASAPDSGAGPSCGQGGAACTSYTECCSADCTGGSCVACRNEGERCLNRPPDRCCGDMTCFGYTCRKCSFSGFPCVSYSDCCSGKCSAGTCVQTCGEPQSPCTSTSQCCSGYTCTKIVSSSTNTCAVQGTCWCQ